MKKLPKQTWPKRGKLSHKGQNGLALTIGGSVDWPGSVALAGMAALRSGCDLSVICAPEKVAWVINTLTPDLITKKFKGDWFEVKHAKEILEFSKKFDAVLIGGGMGRRPATVKFVETVTKKINKPLIIDADAVKEIKLKDLINSIITPHSVELEILLKKNKKQDLIKKLKKTKTINEKAEILQAELKQFLNKNNILLLKGPVDLIISKNEIYYNKTGNPAMTIGGTGDVLAGVCLGFLAQTKNLWQSACLATYYNGQIGDLVFKDLGYKMLASDMIKRIKKFRQVFKK